MNKKIIAVVVIFFVLFVGFFVYQNKKEGQLVDEVTPVVQNDKINVTTPTPGTVVTSPLKVTGSARGLWYFEASFPVKIYDANQKELGVVPAQAKSDWMTTEFVPFEATLTFQTPTTETGTLVLQKDNPSGLPANEDSVTIPIRFVKTEVSTKTGTLSGQMTIGPVCPVERVDNPCRPTAEMYAARKISVSTFDKKKLIATIIPDSVGKFSIKLSEGTYSLSMMQDGGVGSVKGLPERVVIKRGATVSLSIDVDTGIR